MKKAYIYILFLLILCITSVFLLSSNYFEIKRIVVNGNKVVKNEQIIGHSSIHLGENIFRINTRKAMQGIFNNPYIKKIKIKRKLPHTIIISVIEREEIALIPYVGSYLNIDEEGMIVKISTFDEKPNLPIVEGLEFDTFKIGKELDVQNHNQLTVTVDVVKEIKKAGMIGIINKVDISDIYSIKLQTNNEIKVNLGENINLTYKMAYTRSIIKDIEKSNQKGTIEMSHDGDPIFKPEVVEDEQ